MAEQTHTYDNQVTWEKARQGRSETAGRPSITVGNPPEFGGPEGAWSPEHLTVAAVNSCIMLMFVTIAENSKVAISAYQSTATGKLEESEGRTLITEVTVRPHIRVPSGTDPAKIERLLRMAEKNCFVSNSLRSTVTVEADIAVE